MLFRSNELVHLLGLTLSNDKSHKRSGRQTADVRQIARTAGRRVATNISQYWSKASSAAPGQILLMDMFSGCGGMSTGFRAANGLGGVFDIRGAVDIDPVANESFALNHGVEPLCEDLSSLAKSPKKLSDFLNRTGFGEMGPKVLIGCTPCQGFSSHRNEVGQKIGRAHV